MSYVCVCAGGLVSGAMDYERMCAQLAGKGGEKEKKQKKKKKDSKSLIIK